MKQLIQGARLVSARDGYDGVADVLIENGTIAAIGVDLPPVENTLDARGLCLAPGFVDLFAKANEPAQPGQEDLWSMARAGGKGGYTALCAHTGLITKQQAEHVCERAQYAVCDILPAAHALDGKQLLNFGELKVGGVCAIYQPEGIDHPMRMRNTLFRARKNGLPLLSRCRERRLYGEGVIREGTWADLLEMAHIPVSAESIMVARDIFLARETGTPVHIGHISTAQSVELIRKAKEEGLPITCSTEPHYFALSAKELQQYSTRAKLDPPLGNPSDVEALVAGLVDGTIDCIASGHTPIPDAGKNKSLLTAECGASSLETALSVCLSYLYHEGHISLPRMVELLSTAPAEVLGLPTARLAVGAAADLVLFDTEHTFVCSGADFVSQSKTTPFEQKTLRGRVVHTLKAGRFVLKDWVVQ